MLERSFGLKHVKPNGALGSWERGCLSPVSLPQGHVGAPEWAVPSVLGMHQHTHPLCSRELAFRESTHKFLEEAYSFESLKWKVHSWRPCAFVVEAKKDGVVAFKEQVSKSLDCGALWGPALYPQASPQNHDPLAWTITEVATMTWAAPWGAWEGLCRLPPASPPSCRRCKAGFGPGGYTCFLLLTS